MRRIAVIGCGGAGKTTLARRIGQALGIEVVHADFLRHDADGSAVPEDEWRARHADILRRGSWILDAMKLSVLDERLEAADTAIFLDLPRRTCLLGVLQRRLRFRGRVDRDLGVADVVNLEFLRWVWRFHRHYRPKVVELLERHAATTEIIVLRSRADVDGLLSDVRRDAVAEARHGVDGFVDGPPDSEEEVVDVPSSTRSVRAAT